MGSQLLLTTLYILFLPSSKRHIVFFALANFADNLKIFKNNIVVNVRGSYQSNGFIIREVHFNNRFFFFFLSLFPSTVEPKHAETAGTMMAFLLIIGLALGAGFSFVITMNL